MRSLGYIVRLGTGSLVSGSRCLSLRKVWHSMLFEKVRVLPFFKLAGLAGWEPQNLKP